MRKEEECFGADGVDEGKEEGNRRFPLSDACSSWPFHR